ncbi:MAG: MFS transporter, partial [Acidobacteria bacterium]
MTGDGRLASVADATALVARIESVPFSRWHLRPRIIVGSATFFDAFDALSLAFVLPVLVGLWHLSPAQVGNLIAIGYLGQFLGALAFGWLAESFGRIRSAAAAVAIMSVMSLGCAISGNYATLLACRFVQGIGVGGEMPVAAVYVNELSKAHGRGRFFLLYELIFPIGLMVTGQIGAVLVPAVGWQVMLLIGGVPGLLIALLILGLPESPRWLIAKGRLAEAETIVSAMEASTDRRVTLAPLGERLTGSASSPRAEAAPQSGWSTLLSGVYRTRTVIAWTL